MTRPLPPLVSDRLTGWRAGVTSVCTAHPIAIEAALSLALRTGERVLIEATCNQVNQHGGYTGMTPAGFRAFVERLALEAGVDAGRFGRTDQVEKGLIECVNAANRVVRSIRNREPGFSDMATTLDVMCLARQGGRPAVYFAHVGNSAIWLHRTGSPGIELLTKVHGMTGGPLLRAVGLSPDVLPDIGQVRIRPGDRIFLTTASSAFSFSTETLESVAISHANEPLANSVAALAEVARSGGGTQSITVVAAELGESAAFFS